MSHARKIEMTEALLPYHDSDAQTLGDVRKGVLTLLELRSGFLPQIVNHLTRKGITPQMLCPIDLDANPVAGDDGHGPTAQEFLSHEPRMIRWLLGIGQLEPWPRVVDDGSQSVSVRQLIMKADRSGGDDPSVNEPCSAADAASADAANLVTAVEEWHDAADADAAVEAAAAAEAAQAEAAAATAAEATATAAA